MVFVHSFQAAPMLQTKFRSLETGLKVVLVDYAYSVECVHKFGHTIELYTDALGAEFLKLIPYDKVHIVTNDITTNWHFAASIKFKALQSMSLDQCLIDGDIFLENPIAFELIKNADTDIVVSMYEPVERIFKPELMRELFYTCRDAKQPGYELPDVSEVKGWYNTSLLKFNSESLKQEYIRQYIAHIKEFENRDINPGIWPDIVVEQFNIEALLRNTNSTISMINPYYDIDDEFAYKIGFCHLGVAKEIAHSYYLRMLQTINYQLSVDLQNYYIYLMKDFIPNYKP